ncbi:aspartate/glutamate racemase family protein [Flagellimonas sp. CMM7]|uniref:aspartate/glutamate racemase family protein n=1 Tax=Flagellimonas sp. CMM7 TaxID=2654676 RepID=UPI0013D3A313|nr:aspartate/glutamate racemase family protein [Flagellimonas sp. CMM7]UII80996.1 aspartate/glutamate racemase family protein [Flagellimonas sp. CMM7]
MEDVLKIMYLNPVGFDSYDAFFAEMIKENKYSNTEVHVTSLNPTVGQMDNLEYRTYNALIASDLIKATRQASADGFDALIVGCFYDPYLLDVREISGDMVVVAPCQSSIEIALKLSNKFSVIIGQKKWEHEMHSTIKEYGYGGHLASFRDVGMNVCEFQKDHDITANNLFRAAEKAVKEDFAESVILGCTCEFGFFKEIQDKLEVPVIDPSLAALKQAEQAAILKKQYGWKPSRKWSCEPPLEQDIAQFGLFSDEYQFGNRIIVS